MWFHFSKKTGWLQWPPDCKMSSHDRDIIFQGNLRLVNSWMRRRSKRIRDCWQLKFGAQLFKELSFCVRDYSWTSWYTSVIPIYLTFKEKRKNIFSSRSVSIHKIGPLWPQICLRIFCLNSPCGHLCKQAYLSIPIAGSLVQWGYFWSEGKTG